MKVLNRKRREGIRNQNKLKDGNNVCKQKKKSKSTVKASKLHVITD